MPTPCPVCGRQPDVDFVDPWPKRLGPPPWYALCYQGGDNEHFVGGDRDDGFDTKEQALAEWERVCAVLTKST